MKLFNRFKKVSCEDENTTYIDLGFIRLIYRYGKYHGWYRA